MLYIAFKRIKTHQLKEQFQDTLPQDYIVEFSNFNKTVHTTENDYEILNEEHFAIELTKNKDLLTDFTNQKIRLEQANKKHMEQVEQLAKANNKEEFQLYLQFLNWKKEMEAESLKLKKLESERLDRIRQGIGTKDDEHPIVWGCPLKQNEQIRKDQMKTQGIK